MIIAILGATRGMGRALARAAAARGDQLILLGRELDELQRSAADLGVRAAGAAPVPAIACDLATPAGFGPALDAAWAVHGRIDAVVVTAGLFGTQDALEADLELAARLLTVNLTHTVVFCEEARKRLLTQGGGRLCVFSSVAGDRGRKPVGIYGASKAGLSHYLESLDHKYRAAGLITLTVKPGFVKTGMTAGLKPPPFAGEPDGVAQDVLRALDAGRPVLYTPAMWGLVMAVIRRLPRFIMRRVGF
jgi:NAD(P)-dependent dehydrogenase (short-subunit alcohol dehydrogenase family)